MVTVNLTVELTDKEQAHHFQYFVESQVSKLKDYQILTDTKVMYEKDATFRRISKGLKDARKIRNDYINEHNGRYSK